MTPSRLRELFFWNPETGRIFWRSRYGGREAFVSVQSKGYLYGKLEGKNYLAHRVIWALETGSWPRGEIDHINQNRKDNRFCNLRDVLHVENCRNRPLNKNSSSRVLGVCRTGGGKWRAHVAVRGRQHHLGVFATKEEAETARREADQLYGFSERHGTLIVTAAEEG